MGGDNFIDNGFHPFTVEATHPGILAEQLVDHALHTALSQQAGRQIVKTVIYKILSHDRHWAEHAWHPILVGGHTALFPMGNKDSPIDRALPWFCQMITIIQG